MSMDLVDAGRRNHLGKAGRLGRQLHPVTTRARVHLIAAAGFDEDRVIAGPTDNS